MEESTVDGQQTADMDVESVGKVDVYTPKSTTSENAMLRSIADKSGQAVGVLVQTDVPPDVQASMANRLWGKPEASNIHTLFFQNSAGQITTFTRP